MITYGFYNSVNHDRMYDAIQMSSIFDGVINDGVFLSQGNKFNVKAYSGMTIHVDTGKAWFNHTWTLNDTIYPLVVPSSESILKRIDAVVLEVDSTVSVRANSIKIVKGTPASTPKRPTMVNTDSQHQYPLAYINVSPGVTSITNSDITIVVGTSECPFVTGILQNTTVDQLFTRWETDFNTWFEDMKGKLSGDVAAKLQTQIYDLGSKISGLEYATIPGLTKRVEDNETAIGNLQTNMGSAQASITDHNTRLATAENGIKNNKTNISTNASNITKLTTRVTTAESNITSHGTRLGTAESNISGLSTRMGTAESNISGHGTRLGTAESNINGLSGRMGTAETNISNVTTKVNNALEMISGTLGAGSTSITLRNSRITANSIIEPYYWVGSGSAIEQIAFNTITVGAGYVTMTFDALSYAINVGIRVS